MIGHWNRAILSPAGIAKRLFGLSADTPVQVLIPLDTVAPYHVCHDAVTVIPSGDRLIVAPEQNTYENLVKAIVIARKALADLPHTPMLAAGLNLSFESATEIDLLQEATVSAWDDRLSDKGFDIEARSVARSLKWRNGTINVTIKHAPGGVCSVVFNFDFKSTSTVELQNWLDLSADQIKQEIEALLFNTIRLSPEDVVNV